MTAPVLSGNGFGLDGLVGRVLIAFGPAAV